MVPAAGGSRLCGKVLAGIGAGLVSWFVPPGLTCCGFSLYNSAMSVGFPCQRGEILLEGGSPMGGETRRKFDRDFREGAVRLVRETGKPVAQVARDLGVNEGTLGNWVNADRRRRDGGDGQLSEDERAELVRLRKENAGLQMVTCSNAAWPSGSRTRWAGSRGRLHRRPEGAARRAARGQLPGAGGVPVLVLQVEGRSAAAAGCAAGAAESRGRAPVRRARGCPRWITSGRWRERTPRERGGPAARAGKRRRLRRRCPCCAR